uniref:Farnesyl pyrophosphate synthase n=1 Tax=Ips pini TaxID=102803 RepID=Q58GE9_IPSPI|nr:farnesyl diphosphate synthase [Ips pini]
MFSMKACRNRPCTRWLKEFRRNISKTSTDKNSDAIIRSQDKMQHASKTHEVAFEKNLSYTRWMKQMQHNNIRALSTIQQTLVRPQQSSSLASKEQSRDFMAQFPDIIRELTEVGRNQELPEVMKRYARVLQYNTPNGKKTRGLITISTYKMLEDPAKITTENLKKAGILGWCIEMLHTYFLIIDDIIDHSDTRRGAICWYRQPGIGLTAVYDAVMMENGVYLLLKRHFKDHPMYTNIIELFHDMALKTSLGQSLDTMCLNDDGKPKLDIHNEQDTSIVNYKTSYYSFYLPVAAAMYLLGMDDPEQHRQARTILLDMGQFFQIQDDFLDCFGDPNVTGKLGTDIQDGKCSWLAVMALQRSTPAQRKIMEEHYGRSEPESVAIIKQLYEDLTLPNTYAIYEEESFNIIKTHIQQISKDCVTIFSKHYGEAFKRES